MRVSTVALQPAFDRLDQIADLGPNWDSYGAASISSTAIAATQQLLTTLDGRLGAAGERLQPYAIVPIANGGLQIEWRRPENNLEVEIGPGGEMAYLLLTGQAPARVFEEQDQVTEDSLLELLERILTQQPHH